MSSILFRTYFLVAFFQFFFFDLAAAPPANDSQANAIVLTQLNNWTSSAALYTNVDATNDGSMGSCGAPNSNVWFKFQATTTYIKFGVLVGAAEGSLRGPAMSLRNSAGSEITCGTSPSSSTNDKYIETSDLVIGEWYYVSVHNAANSISYRGTFTLFANQQRFNDMREWAVELTQKNRWSSAAYAYTNVGATSDGSSGACGSPSSNVWFKFQATTTYMELRALTGTGEGTLQRIGIALWNDPGSQEMGCVSTLTSTDDALLEVNNLIVGEWYYASVQSGSGSTSYQGTFSLYVNDQPPFNLKAGAIELIQKNHWTSAAYAYTNVGATSDGSSGTCGSPYSNVWFKFQAATQYIDLRALTGTNEGTILGVGITLWDSSNTQVACISNTSNTNDALIEVSTLTIGEWYYVSVQNGSGIQSNQGTFTLYVNDQASYNWKAGALELTQRDNWTSAPYAYTNVGATNDGLSGTCGSPNNNVWFKFLASTTHIDFRVLTGTGEGTIREVDVTLWNSSGSQVACVESTGSTNDVKLEIGSLVIGQWYYASVGNNYSGTTHQGTFTLYVNQQPTFDYKAGAITLSQKNNWCSPLAFYTNVGATDDGISSSCGAPTRNVWFKFQAQTPYVKFDLKSEMAEGTMTGGEMTLWSSAGVQVSCVDNLGPSTFDVSIVNENLTIGEWYYVSVFNRSTSSTAGTFTICINDQPNFDSKSYAIELQTKNWLSAPAVYSNVGASTGGESSTCGTLVSNVWFKFQASTNYVHIDLKTGGAEGTIRFPAIALFNNSNVQVGCQGAADPIEDIALERSNLQVGQWYYVSVSSQGASSDQGTFTFGIFDRAECVNPPIVQTLQSTPVCAGFTNGTITLTNTESDVVYTLSNGQQVTGVAGQSKTWSDLPTGNYTVTATRSTCPAVSMGSIAVNIASAITSFQTSVVGTPNLCEGEAIQIQLSGSENLVNYQLKRTPGGGGAETLVQQLAGTGASLVFASQTLEGQYKITGTTALGCVMQMQSMVFIKTKPLEKYIDGTTTICQGTSGTTLSLNSTDIGVNYELIGPGTSLVKSGTGGRLEWTNLGTAGTYSMKATAASTGCSVTFTQTAKLVIAAMPSDYVISSNQSICSGGSALITINGSQSNVKYQVKTTEATFGSSVDGKGNSAVLPLVRVTKSGAYQVIATNNAGCSKTLSGTSTVTVNPLPSPFTVEGGGALTSTQTSFPVTLSSSEGSMYSYQLMKDGVSIGSPLNGNNATLTWPSQTGKGSYTIKATNSTTGCINLMNGSATIFESFETILNNLSFQYKYDARKRMVAKKVPGADWVFMVYDKRDRLVMTQDGEQRKNKKWSYTKYDALNRPVMTGIYTHNEILTQQQMSDRISGTDFFETYNGIAATHGYSNTVWPTENTQLLSATYYDSYSFITPLVYDGNANATTHNYQLVGLTDQYQYNTPGNQKNFPRVVGQVTGTKTNILGTNEYLYGVSYYDDKYRLVQSIHENHKGGTIVVSSTYDFAGKVLETKRSYLVQGENTDLKEVYSYDHAGRLLTVKHTVSGANGVAEVVLTKNKYNALGQLIDKKLHSTDNETSFKQSVDYRYNIRGWLTKINESNLNGGDAGDPKDLFGMQLAYNDDISTGNAAKKQFNGNISGIKWSANRGVGTTKERGYNFTYDKMNRLEGAESKNNVAGAWSVPMGNSFNEDSISYDLNGNILSLNRKGANGASIDILSYSYYDGLSSTRSNQLLKVSDRGDKSKGFVDGVNGGRDYEYDANGNMRVDRNKDIESITYNHLNLPLRVTKKNGDYIEYTYDAGGTKLYQTVYSSETEPASKVTDYVGELILENDELKLINHSEGRIVPDGNAWEYQYHLKDHLGNVRTTFTSKVDVETVKATLETVDQVSDKANFLRYDEARLVSSPLFDKTNDALGTPEAPVTGYAQRLNGSQNEKFGLARSISVMPGDTVTTEVFAKYIDGNKNNWTTALKTLLTQIATGGAAGTTVIDGGSYNLSTSNFPFEIDALANTEGNNESGPKAYLNWLVYDKNFVLLDGGFDRLSSYPREFGQNIGHERLFSSEIPITEPGYVYIYLSNEDEINNVEVYFDDFKVTHTKSPVIQSDDYYPFGLTFNSYSRENSVKNRYLYNQGTGDKKFNTERIFDLGLDVDMTKFRVYDPAIGRWWQVDPKSDQEGQEIWSPYNYAFDNPIRYNDPNGDCIPCIIATAASTFSALKVKYSNIAKPGQEAGQRLIGNKSGSTPPNTGMSKTEQQIIKMTGVAQDGVQVAKSAKNVATEVVKDGGKGTQEAGDTMQKVGIATSAVGLPQVGGPLVAVGTALSTTGTVLSTAANVMEGNYSGAATQVAGAVIDNKASGVITNVVAKQGMNEQSRAILEANKEVIKEVAVKVAEQVTNNQ